MGIRSTRAVVSNAMRMTGSSKLVTLVTERYGLVKVMAKGARRPKSKYGAALEPVTLIDCQYWFKDTREIQTLSEADIVDDFPGLKGDIKMLSTAACMAEIARSQTAAEDPSSGTFPLLVESLDGLEQATTKTADKHLWRFMLRFLAAAGYRPVLDTCAACGKTPRGGAVFLDFAAGGVVCSCTATEGNFGIRVSPGALMVMNELLRAGVDELPRLKMSPAQRSEVEETALKFLAWHSGYSRPPRALSFLRKMEAAGKKRNQGVHDGNHKN